MKREVIKAINESIRKWERIITGVESDKGQDDCPLCLFFKGDNGESDCVRCPVYDITMAAFCRFTPYVYWVEHQRKHHAYIVRWKVHCPECEKLAKNELNFLKSLLKSKQSEVVNYD